MLVSNQAMPLNRNLDTNACFDQQKGEPTAGLSPTDPGTTAEADR